jgi:hypothetical protein
MSLGTEKLGKGISSTGRGAGDEVLEVFDVDAADCGRGGAFVGDGSSGGCDGGIDEASCGVMGKLDKLSIRGLDVGTVGMVGTLGNAVIGSIGITCSIG